MPAVECRDLDPALARPSPFEEDGEQPWMELGLTISADDDRLYTLYIQLLEDFLHHRQYVSEPTKRYYEPLRGVRETPPLFLSPWEEPWVLVDAEYFDMDLVDRLLFSQPEVRRRIMLPFALTPAEEALLSKLAEVFPPEEGLHPGVEPF